METEERRAAKVQLVRHMLQGQPWHAATTAASLCVSRATAYRLLQRVRTEGEAALTDGRHGHPIKLRAPLRHWLEEFWRDRPQAQGFSPLYKACIKIGTLHQPNRRIGVSTGRLSHFPCTQVSKGQGPESSCMFS